MPVISIIRDIDTSESNPVRSMHEENIVHVKPDVIIMGTLANGMSSGKSSVAIIIDLPDGKVLIAETSLACCVAALSGLKGIQEQEEQNGEQQTTH